jgi:signal transduction histidine kinase
MTMLDESEVEVWHNLYAAIIEDADSNILILDDELQVITLNAGFYWIFLETYGIELKKGTSILLSMEKSNPDLTKLWEKRCQAALAGTPIKVEDEFEMDGRSYFWEINFKSGTLANERQILSVYSRDITVQKAYQRKIIGNEANLRSILNTIENSVWLINDNHELIDFNKDFYKKYKQAFGIKLTKGKNILDLVPHDSPQLRETWKARYEAGLKGRPGKYIDSYPLGGVLRTYEIKTYPIVQDSMVTGLTIYSRDITQYYEAEHLLKAKNEELLKINEELDRFVYSASHDMRAPLMSIKGLANIMKREPGGESLSQYLNLIDKSINKLDHFITDITNYSRNSRLEIDCSIVDLEALAAESIESLKYMEEADKVHISVNLNGDVDFYSDARRLLVLFNNIISNAIRYYASWKESYLRIEMLVDGQKAVISFEDNGIGIAEEFQDRIFKMFFRASFESKGSGLGLYIVKSTVDKLGGSISVKSKLGEGTLFSIVLPNRQIDMVGKR